MSSPSPVPPASPAPARSFALRERAARPLSAYLAGIGAAVMFSALAATQNYIRAERGVSWPTLFLLELPVFFTWLLAAPAIFWLARCLPVHGPHRWRNLLLHLPLSAVTVFVTLVVIALIKFPMLEGTPTLLTHEWGMAVLREYRRIFAVFIPFYWVVLAAAHAVHAYRESQRRGVREAQLQTQLERARGDLLRMQLQPHFLFNTLHAISALMERDVPAARRMITRLSDLLRLSLDNDSRYEVSLEEEVEFLDRYAEIQKIRFGGRLSVEYDLAPETRRLLVPRLLLQPLVENSITHGLSGLERPGRVCVESRAADGRLTIRVLDDGAGLDGGAVAREGVGLGNTRARLEQLYGADHRFEIADLPDGGCEVRIDLPASVNEREPHGNRDPGD